MKFKFEYFPANDQPYEYEEDLWEMRPVPERHYVQIIAENNYDHVVMEDVHKACINQRIHAVRIFDDLLVYFENEKEKTWFTLTFVDYHAR